MAPVAILRLLRVLIMGLATLQITFFFVVVSVVVRIGPYEVCTFDAPFDYIPFTEISLYR